MLYERDATGTVDEIQQRLEEATKANGFGVIQVINLNEKMAAKGVTFDPACRIVEICGPTQAKALLEANMSVSAVMPCRISVYETGGKVKVSTVKPTALLDMFGDPGLGPVAEAVEEIIVRIVDAACE